MRLLLCGTRNWPGAWEDIAVHLPEDGADVTILHGACSNVVIRDGHRVQVSVDTIVDWIAHGLGWLTERFPADWQRDGKSAGPKRNARMLAEGKPDRGIAFGALYRSKSTATSKTWKRTGTGDMVNRMLRAGLPVRWIEKPGAHAIDLTEMPRPAK